MERHLYSCVRIFNIVKMALLTKLILRLNVKPIRISTAFFGGRNRIADSKIHMKVQGTQNSQNNFFKIILYFKFFMDFIYLWQHWVFVAAHVLSLAVASGGYSSLWCTGFSLRWLLLFQSMGSRYMGFSSCVMRAQ